MKIIYEPKLDFDDVLLVPQRSKSASRSEVDLIRNFNFFHSSRKWKGIPICVANMDTTGTFDMAKSTSKHNIVTCLHKHYAIEDYRNFCDLNYCWYSMGIKQADIQKLSEFIDRFGFEPNICIDVANGYTDDFVEFCKSVREIVQNESIIMAGNICTPEMVQELILHGGVDIVKVGIGPGSACTTRLKTGVGYPQLSAISECSHAAHGLVNDSGIGGLICADGGCRIPADVVKAFAANADFVMLGGMFAGTEECEGEWQYEYLTKPAAIGKEFWQSVKPGYDTVRRKVSLQFYGMSSHKAQEKYGEVKKYRGSEGRELTIPYKGTAEEVIMDALAGIRSACTYVGTNNLKNLPKCAEFVLVNRVHSNTNV
jgi:GMP reductase